MIHVRSAARGDIAVIIRMKQALLEAEPANHLPPCSEQDWLRDLFGTGACFLAVVAECDGAVVGAAICNRKRITGIAASLLYLQDLFVDEAHRRRGIATRLLGRVAELAVAEGAALIELNVRADNPARTLYRQVGFECATCRTYVMAGQSLTRMAGVACDLTGLA